MQQRFDKLARIRLARLCRALRAPVRASVRWVTLLAFVVASVSMPLDVASPTAGVAAGDLSPADELRTTAVPRITARVQQRCTTTGLGRCGCSVPVQRAGRCCCSRPAAMAPRKSCCATSKPSDAVSGRQPEGVEGDAPRRTDWKSVRTTAGRTGSPSYGSKAASNATPPNEREAPADPVLRCPCGQSDLAWTVVSGEPRLLNSCTAAVGDRDLSSLPRESRVPRPVNSAVPETPPPERRGC